MALASSALRKGCDHYCVRLTRLDPSRIAAMTHAPRAPPEYFLDAENAASPAKARIRRSSGPGL